MATMSEYVELQAEIKQLARECLPCFERELRAMRAIGLMPPEIVELVGRLRAIIGDSPSVAVETPARKSCELGGDVHCRYWKLGHPYCSCGATVSEGGSHAS